MKLERRLARLQRELKAIRKRLHKLEYLLRYNAKFTPEGGYKINIED